MYIAYDTSTWEAGAEHLALHSKPLYSHTGQCALYKVRHCQERPFTPVTKESKGSNKEELCMQGFKIKNC